LRDADLHRTETVLSWLLRIGVLASCAVIMAGLVLLLATGQTGYGMSARGCLQSGGPAAGACDQYPTSVSDAVIGVRELRPFAIIAAGLLLLIATPILRVAVSVLTFLAERDYAYVGFTAFVLLMLCVSFLVGKAGE